MIRYRADIDGLRAVAIVTVVASHVGLPGWSGGYVGVDIFFVISGFLITSLLLNETREAGRIDLWGFYARRVRRLLPALLTVITVSLALGAVLLGRIHGEVQGLARSALSALLLSSNHYFFQATGNYFDRPAELHPLLHLWSLSLEEQFYLIWPPVLAVMVRRRSAGFESHGILAVLGAALSLSAAACIWLTSVSPSAAFYLMPTRAWELALGGLLALVPFDRLEKRRNGLGVALGWLGGLAIAVAVVFYGPATPFPGISVALPVLGTAALIAGNAIAPAGLPATLLSTRPMVHLGLLSYSWYLWHWPLVSLARSVDLGRADLARDALLGGALALLLAAATYRWIERPIRHSGELKRRGSRATLRLGLAASCVCALFAGGLGAWAKFSPRSPLEARLMAAQMAESPLRAICNNVLEEQPRLPAKDPCTVREGRSGVDLVLWGDSMADHWMPGLVAAAESLQLSVLQLTRDSCPPLLGFEIVHSDPAQRGRCLEFQVLAFEEIRRLREREGLRAVALSMAWAAAANGPLADGLERTVAHLEELGLDVVILGPTPRLPFAAPDCLWRREPSGCALPRSELDLQRAQASRAIAAVASRHSRVISVDPAPYLCDEVECPAARGPEILYRDAAHLTASTAAGFGPYLAGALARLE